MRFKKPRSLLRKGKTSTAQTQTPGRTAIPAHCGHCGALFATTSFVHLAEGAYATFSDVGVNCPKCGATAHVLDGTFERIGDTLRLLSGPQLTKGMLRAFGTLIGQAARKQINTEDLQKKASDLDESLGAVVAQAINSRWGFALLVVLLVFLKTCHFNIDAKLDLNKLWDQTFGSGAVHETSKVERKVENTKTDPPQPSQCR